MSNDLNIPNHRPGARIATVIAIAVIVGAILAAIFVRFDNDPAVTEHNHATTTTAPTFHKITSVSSSQIVVQGEVYDINAPDRPACWMEPSNTPEGYEVILYPHLSMHNDADLGFEVSCPEPGQMGPIVVPCQEDEVVAPAIDHDPHHGLTWACVNAEQYIAGERPHV